MAVSNRDRIDRALELIGVALDAFITRVVGPELPEGADWTAMLAAKDQQKGASATKKYNRVDPQNGLRVVSERVPGWYKKGWRPLGLSPVEESWASELRDVRDRHAHRTSFSGDDAYRALDTAERFLRAIGAPEEADEVKRTRVDLRRISSEQDDRRVTKTSAAAEVGADNLPPWREILAPHPDVASGNFHAAEFAADLAMVARNEGDSEYTDPVEFFNRTFLTGGLRDLILRMARRMTGDRNASPVVNLQTNFGGGKTHSMLALWHLASGRRVADYPQELQDLLRDVDLDSVAGRIGRVALVGNHLAPAKPREVEGVTLNTLWGELAWQLGGRDAYELIAESDRTATNPGGTLRELFELYTPAIILVDEWVSYSRQLYGQDRLPGGNFDTQFTFAQTLTETAKAVPGIQVIISIPASDDAKNDGGASDEEVGGEYGREALRRLQNVVRRTADQWRAANSEESFEIVRRRLFVPPDAEALAKISATATGMVKYYRSHDTQFPREARENDYIDRIKRSYPVHPELFDRLYENWSTLERFQRTRGVLRLMNTIVGELWRSNDAAPLILPGSVPLDSDNVVTELTQYLDDRWKGVIDADVDGTNSSPAQVDNGNRLFGARRTTRRLARATFVGAAPTLDTAHKGIEKSRMFLGTALPGDIPGNFHAALDSLANLATYFYSDGSKYWYDTQANTTRTARDYAEQLRAEDVWHEITQRLEKHRATGNDGFTRVHVAPDSSADVPDIQETRLVIVPPAHPYDRKQKAEAPASKWADDAFAHRGTAARQYANTLCFLAADSARLAELDAATRDYLAWRYVEQNVVALDLKPQQAQQATERRTRADETVRSRLLDTYTWLMYPQQNPGSKATLEAIKAEGTTDNLATRAAKRARDQSQLVLTRAASLIRYDLDGSLASVWTRDGHIAAGTLWELYTTYPYLVRMRNREVFEDAVQSVWGQMLWEQEGYALAEGYEDGEYVGLTLPGDDVNPPAVTDSLLLVEPSRARAQRDREIEEVGGGKEEGTQGGTEPHPRKTATPPKPTGPAPKTRYFGTRTLDPQRYAADFGKINSEILQHLSAQPGVSLEVRIEIEATAPDGFDDSRVRIVRENAEPADVVPVNTAVPTRVPPHKKLFGGDPHVLPHDAVEQLGILFV